MPTLTAEQNDVVLEGLRAVLAKKTAQKATPATLAAAITKGKYQIAPHLELLSRAIVDAANGIQSRLIVTMPPRHGKSETVSHWTPVWLLDRHPEKRIVLASYEADFAASWGRKVRNTIAANPGMVRAKLSGDNKAADSWTTTAGGGMITAGVNGPITGKGGDLLIIDDPVKNSAEADSETYRNRTWEWWQSTAYTRLEPGSSAMVVMTRWHEDDLAGRLIEQSKVGGEQWRVINLPAIAEGPDEIGRKLGDALWPERYGEADLERIQSSVGSRVWSALYQQRPSPAEGGIIKRNWWQFWDASSMPSRFDAVIHSWDMAFKDTKSSDFVVGQVWGRKGANWYLLDQVRGRMDFVATETAVERLSLAWPMGTAKYVEEKANGAGIIARLKGKVPGLIAVNPKDSKLARVNAITPLIEAGNVFLPRGAAWVDGFIEECAAFPNGAHDDMVDAMSQALSQGARSARSAFMQAGSLGY